MTSSLLQTHHKACSQHEDVPHILFDYHAEVKSGADKNLANLKHKVQKYMEKFGFFTRRGTDVTRYFDRKMVLIDFD
jgi:phosphatidylinositol-bisphosphatase